jgi:NADH-quinone oxidoreductase subunit G
VLGQRLPFDTLAALRAALYAAHPHFAAIDDIAASDATAIGKLSANGAPSGAPGKDALASPITDFYLTNPIARASSVMAECSALARGRMLQAAE